jgi:hypothetical protein
VDSLCCVATQESGTIVREDHTKIIGKCVRIQRYPFRVRGHADFSFKTSMSLVLRKKTIFNSDLGYLKDCYSIFSKN